MSQAPAPKDMAKDVAIDEPVSLARSIGVKMTVLSRQMRQRFDENVERMGVTRAKWVLIATVASNPGTTQREIAARLEVSDVTAGRMIDRVCADGLIERRENPQDRRAYRIFLLPAATPLLAQLSTVAKAHEEAVFGCMTEDELTTLDTLLEKLSAHLGSARRDPGERKALRDVTLTASNANEDA